DFKTTNSGEVYEDHVLQLAAYGILWKEQHPKEELASGYHLILLPKDGSKPIHRAFTDEQMHPFRQKFWLYRKAYELEAVCANPKTLQGAEVKPSRAAKPRARVVEPVAPTPHLRSMAEVLRTYGHVQASA